MARSTLLLNVLFVLLLALAAYAQATAPKVTPTELASLLDAYMDQETTKDEFSGVVLVAKDGKAFFLKAYGFANREFQVPNRTDTRFNLGSLNKLFTNVALGDLIRQGKVSLNDPVIKFLPDYPNSEAARKVTVRHLLAHSSGIGDIFGDKFRASSKDSFRVLSDYLPLFASEPLRFEPGSQREYSNGGYIVLGLIIEKASGQSYYDYVREHVFQPAGMANTDSYEADVPVPNVAMGYTRGLPGQPPNSIRRANFYSRPARGSSAGGGYSTAEDMLKFAISLEAGSLRLPEVARSGDQLIYLGGIGAIGGAPGINAALETQLPGNFTVIVLSNYDPPSAVRVAKQVRRYLGLLEEK